ncbi:inositol phosphorylceramide synthase [Streptacidiphilus sp. PB12-B1b]|uniref:phosphatase PAP2 family protein n=1 Tax=Streptacidiphilus sp. PB12-B1b TaxID=2705012 RepID=UPI0015FCFB85|nr:phosphatase PAP2 family protein [Streptacidiphilus sp. PB12-B1b]QMU78777.1 inositol phosphorylceramide synthase [Streptacidiphilus sp. PB12-B1b]
MQNLTLSWQSAGALSVAVYAGSVLVRRSGRARAGLVLREAATVVALFAVWQFAGQLSVMGTDDAVARGQWIWDTERRLGLPSEAALQRWVLPHPLLVESANYYYAVMHFGVMIALLVWLFLWHRESYPWVRGTLVLVTAMSLAVQLIPVAPPRLLPNSGMVDTAAQYGQSVYGATIGGLQADSFSAMPSVHVAWCVLVAVAVVRVGRSRWRWLILLHPLITVSVVLVTANHYWFDGLAAVALLLLSYLLQWAAGRAAAHWRARAGRPLPAPAEQPDDIPVSTA